MAIGLVSIGLPLGQIGTRQASPKNPSSQSQLPEIEQAPAPEQFRGQHDPERNKHKTITWYRNQYQLIELSTGLAKKPLF